MKKSVAVVTMAYNEINKLPRWLLHYQHNVGSLSNCYIVDHASTDGSTDNLPGVNIIKLERNAGGDKLQSWRADYISGLVNNLLKKYDFVIYTDVDELLCVNPKIASSILEYVNIVKKPMCSAIGFDVLHDFRTEPPLTKAPIFTQRSKLQLVYSMCKAVLINKKVSWTPGFHCSNLKPRFGDLFLFHLRYVDIDEGLKRLQITREIDRPEKKHVPCDHQKISDTTYKNWVESWINYPISSEDIFSSEFSYKSLLLNIKWKKDKKWRYIFDYGHRSSQIYLYDPANSIII